MNELLYSALHCINNQSVSLLQLWLLGSKSEANSHHLTLTLSSTSTYIPNFTEIEETFCGRTDGWTFYTHCIRSTRRSRPNNARSNNCNRFWIILSLRIRSSRFTTGITIYIWVTRTAHINFSIRQSHYYVKAKALVSCCNENHIHRVRDIHHRVSDKQYKADWSPRCLAHTTECPNVRQPSLAAVLSAPACMMETVSCTENIHTSRSVLLLNTVSLLAPNRIVYLYSIHTEQ